MYDFTPEQNTFLSSSGKVVLHACPGSGKTTVVAQKLINYVKSWDRPHQGVAVLSFTNVASQEITRQAQEILPQGYDIGTPHFIGTLDSFIDNFIFLRFGYLLLSSPKRPLIANSNIVSEYNWYWRKECYNKGCVSNIDQFKWIDTNTLTKNGNAITCGGSGRHQAPCIEFKKILREKGLFFQGEIAGLTCILLKEYPEVAKAIASRFPIVILDEAQDTSSEQMEILDLLSNAGIESLYLVGDPDQSIYEWREATPECFLKKMNDKNWTHLSLSKNFRSSQLICNATYVFSNILKDKTANEAKGKNAACTQKPVVLLYDQGIDKNLLLSKFKELCSVNSIVFSPQNVAVVTRSKIHSETNIKELWKTPETEFLARASFEWMYGNRQKAFEFCERALFQLTIKNLNEVEVSIFEEISKIFSYDIWKNMIIDVLVALPSTNLPCGDWIAPAQKTISEILSTYKLSLVNGLKVTDAIKIKKSDKNNPNFHRIPVKNFFEKKETTDFTHSSVHGVKGETYDALMLVVEYTEGVTLTPSFLSKGDTNRELMRIAYVAMTRPRKLLVVAMPNSNANLDARFPKEKWKYISV